MTDDDARETICTLPVVNSNKTKKRSSIRSHGSEQVASEEVRDSRFSSPRQRHIMDLTVPSHLPDRNTLPAATVI
jgi:hypothetical protein